MRHAAGRIDNVPGVSCVVLRGRCRYCRVRIPARYPLVELLTAAVWVLIAVKIGWRPELSAYLIFGTALVILSVLDLDVLRLPNNVLAAATVAGAVLVGLATIPNGDLEPLVHGLEGALAYGIPRLVIGLLSPAGMGRGT